MYPASDKSIYKIARVAGGMLLLSFFVPVLNWALIISKFISAENSIDTVSNILADEFLFRVSIINGICSAVFIAILAFSLYIILESVNKKLALLGLILKLIEAVLWAVLATGHLIALLTIKEETSSTFSHIGQTQTFAGLFLNMYIPITAIPGIFAALNMVIFSFLLCKSKYIPSVLARVGGISYLLSLIYDLIAILMPKYAAMLLIQMITSIPVCFFLLTAGIWLLFKGVKTPSPL
jgi:hypothetical protein